LKKARDWRNGIPWRTPPHFSITRRVIDGETEWTVEILEKSIDRSGMEKLCEGEMELGLGFLR
jgi:hypothetical protein